jgi:hypothetical protein
MIPDAKPFLAEALASYTDPAEVSAVGDFLANNARIAAAITFLNDRIVWLFTGDSDQIAIPIELTPGLTEHARAAGLLDAFFEEFKAEVEATLARARALLQGAS